MESRNNPPWQKPRGAKFLLIGGFFGMVFFGMGAVVMWLWNAILPNAVGAQPLGYWQALGLLILSRILFGGFRWGGPGGGPPFARRQHWREKWMNMSEEEREKLKETWKERCKR